MNGDFSRLTFDPSKHYSRVLVQQGRVQLDADANEQTDIQLHYMRSLAADLIGPYGGPEGSHGFEIRVDKDDLAIGSGRYYVHGLLCENHADDARYSRQPDLYPGEPAGDHRLLAYPFLVYLKVWERHITAIEDPDIRETALGSNGPDTATRTRVVWQVLMTDTVTPVSTTALSDDEKRVEKQVHDAWHAWRQERELSRRGKLRARTSRPADADGDPCIVPPRSGYRGAENQLYRVEVHAGGRVGTATFKWAANNATATFPIEHIGGDEITVTSLGRDRGLGLAVGDWVEIVDDRSVLNRSGLDGAPPPPLRKVSKIESFDRRITLEDGPAITVGNDQRFHPLLRRWDQGATHDGRSGQQSPDGAIRVVETTSGKDHWLDLQDGVQIQFQKDGDYRSGDYWLVPARVGNGVEWPGGDHPDPRPPHGIRYYYAPLALVIGDDDTVDLRSHFRHLAVMPKRAKP